MLSSVVVFWLPYAPHVGEVTLKSTSFLISLASSLPVWGGSSFSKPEKGILRNFCGSRANVLLENGVVCSADVNELLLSEEEEKS